MVLAEILGVVIILLLLYLIFKKERVSGPAEQLQKSLEEFKTTFTEFKSKLEAKSVPQLDEIYKMFLRTSGKGKAGEKILERFFEEDLKLGRMVRTPKLETGEPDFGWKFSDGKYLPIDSKVSALEETAELAALESKSEPSKEDEDKIDALKKEIIKSLKARIKEAETYKNDPKSVGRVAVIVPDSIFDASLSEISSKAVQHGIFIIGQTYAPFVIHSMAYEREDTLKQLHGDVNILFENVKKVNSILEEALIEINNKILEPSGTIQKGVRIVQTKLDQAGNLLKIKKSK
jgi:hypothetical protein